MSHAETCPVCGGSGKLSGDDRSPMPICQTCHGCSGRGWVTIQDPYTPYPPRRPKPQNPPWAGLGGYNITSVDQPNAGGMAFW